MTPPTREEVEAMDDRKLLLSSALIISGNAQKGIKEEWTENLFQMEIHRRLAHYRALLASQPQWQPIETAPRDSSRIIIAYLDSSGEWRVYEAWWKMAYEDATPQQCSWSTADGIVLSSDVHFTQQGKPLGASHWMPLPTPPQPDTITTNQEKT